MRSSIASLILAALGLTAAAAGATPEPAAVIGALFGHERFATCAMQAHASRATYAARAFGFQNVTLASGERMIVATGADSCVCAAQNCPVIVLERTAGTARDVLDSWAISATVRTDGSAVLTAHDNAALSDRTTYRWNGAEYVVARSEIVDQRTGTAKPASIALRFAPGAASTTVSGAVSFGFGDTYVLRANAGQTLGVVPAAPQRNIAGISLRAADGTTLVDRRPGSWTMKLPHGGTYDVYVEGTSDELAPYRLTISLR